MATTDRESGPGLTAGPWNFWQTLGFGILVGLVFLFVQAVVLISFIPTGGPEPGTDLVRYIDNMATNGLILAVMTCATMLACTPLVFLFARLRKAIAVRDYLGFHGIERRQLVVWLIVLAAFVLVWDGLAVLLDRPVVPDFMRESYATAESPLLFWFALVVAAPLFEEVFFRGFLMEGWRHSFLGPYGSVVVTSGLWAVIHSQYDLYEISTIFVLGLVLGAARLKGGSLWLPLIMHSLVNLIATAETVAVSR